MSDVEHSLKTGLSFGLTSATITTLGLMVGLNSSTGSKSIVLGGILTIAIADAFSDALGIHVSEESEGKHTSREVWLSTVATFLSKFIFALTFVLPVLFFTLETAVVVGIIWGFLALSLLSYYIGRSDGNPNSVIFEHLVIAAIVVVLTHLVGRYISYAFH